MTDRFESPTGDNDIASFDPSGAQSASDVIALASALGTAADAEMQAHQGPAKKKKRHYRTVFISDTHLGTRAARVDLLLDFLKHISCDKLYLVGDIVDGWRLKKSWYWDTTHNDIIRKILKLARSGTEVIYIPGNHDEGFRGFTGNDLAGVKTRMDDIFIGADGRKYWVIHGDEFDGVVKYAKWLAHVGDFAYQALLKINTGFNWCRRKLGYSYWSLSAYLKHKVKNAVEFMGDYEEAVATEARRRGVDGVICGHIHHAEMRDIDGILYLNDGDWVESCTALTESEAGEWSIIYWAEEVAARDARALEKARKKKGRKIKDAPLAPEEAPIPPVAAE